MGRKRTTTKPTIVNQPKKVTPVTPVNNSNTMGDSIKSGIATGVGFAAGNAAINSAMNMIGDKTTDAAPKENVCDFLRKNYIECLDKSNNCDQIFKLMSENKCFI